MIFSFFLLASVASAASFQHVNSPLLLRRDVDSALLHSLYTRDPGLHASLAPRSPFLELAATIGVQAARTIATQAVKSGVEKGVEKGAEEGVKQGIKHGVKQGAKAAEKEAPKTAKDSAKEGGKEGAQQASDNNTPQSTGGMPPKPNLSIPKPKDASHKPGDAMKRIKDRWQAPGRKDHARAVAQEMVSRALLSFSVLGSGQVCGFSGRSASASSKTDS